MSFQASAFQNTPAFQTGAAPDEPVLRVFGDPGWFLRQIETPAEKIVVPPKPEYSQQREKQKAAQAEQAQLRKLLARTQAHIERVEASRDRWRQQYENTLADERKREEQALRWQQIEAKKRADEAALLSQIAAQIAAEEEAARQMELMLQAEELELAAILLLN